MNFKGTKGDWYKEVSELKPALDYGKSLYVGTKFNFVAMIFGNSKEELYANASLIEKAPEMLEMLNKCLEVSKHFGVHALSKEIEELIYKATEL